MTIGRNPHVAKARAFEQKADDAVDDTARTRAWRDAAHQWDRASDREKPGKMRDAYRAHAERNRALADGTSTDDVEEPGAIAVDDEDARWDPSSLN